MTCSPQSITTSFENFVSPIWLPGFEDLITDEANDELTPEQLFLTATADALELRREHRVNAMIKKAGFPLPTASVAEINYWEGRGITKVRMQRYATHDWASETLNVIITSPSGGGKAYLACALGIAACQNGHSVIYTRMDDLARALVIARSDSIKHQAMLNEYSNASLLCIDDFLTVGIDPDAAADLFTILANREHKAATMIASQSGPDYWIDVLPDKVATDLILNRLVNHTKKITLGEIDVRRERNEQARQTDNYWDQAESIVKEVRHRIWPICGVLSERMMVSKISIAILNAWFRIEAQWSSDPSSVSLGILVIPLRAEVCCE